MRVVKLLLFAKLDSSVFFWTKKTVQFSCLTRNNK